MASRARDREGGWLAVQGVGVETQNFALKSALIFDNWRWRMAKSAVCVGRFRWNLPRELANFVDSSAQDLIHYAPRKGKKNVY